MCVCCFALYGGCCVAESVNGHKTYDDSEMVPEWPCIDILFLLILGKKAIKVENSAT